MEQTNKKVIDLRTLCTTVLQHWRRYCIVLPIVFALSAGFIVCVPRYYECRVELSPEVSNTTGGGLKSIIANVGLGGLAGAETEAIYPYLYPDLVNSAEFCQSMFDVKVEKQDGSLKTDYHTYLLKHQKQAWWNVCISAVKNALKPASKAASVSVQNDGGKRDNIIRLSKQDNDVVSAIGNNIDCSIDKKTEVIFIKVTDQDPLICATIADTVMTRLQNFITTYRTKKACIDLEYSEKIYANARAEYEAARAAYVGYMDSHRDAVAPAAVAQGQKLENEVSLKFSTLTEVTQQLQIAKAKVQENTPAFTIVQGPVVPLLPAGPKRMLFVLAMLVLGFVGTTLSLFRDRLWELLD